jgi:hypothetical protein
MTNTKLLSFALVASLSTMICPSLAPAVVIYANGFESGLQPTDISQGGDPGVAPNGYCSRSGTNPLLSHTGCPSVVPTSSINAGTGSFVAFATPGQTNNGSPSEGSVLSFLDVPLVDGYHGRYEFSFTGSEVRQLVFVDAVWDAFLFFGFDPPPLVEIPQSFEGGTSAGTSLSIEDNRHLVTFDLDERTRFFSELGPPGEVGFDPAFPSICGPDGSQTSCTLSWSFAIDNGGWLDDIELNYLGIPVPEPGTLYLILTGLIAAGIIKLRRAAT